MSKLMTYEADLNEVPVKPQEFKSPLYLGEKNAHTIRVNLKSTEAVPADATCEGYFIYLDTQQTVKIPEAKCSYSNGVAEVTLTPDCYQIVSRVSFIMALGNLADKIVILNLAGRVISSWTDIVVESGDLENIPDLQTLVDMINAVNHLDISSSKSGRIITITTTDRHGATQSSTITEPTATVTKEENGPYHLTVTDVNGTTITDIPDPASEVKKKANRSSVTADRTISGKGKVEFPDALDEPMSLELELEPKQDLHGYDKPWVGGSGKNLLDMSQLVLNGTWNGDTYSKETITARPKVVLSDTPSNFKLSYSAFSFSGSNVRIETFNGDTLVGSHHFVAAGASGISMSGITAVQINYGNNGTFSITQPMISLATETDPTYEPYSNICPITGYDAVEVVSTGKNLFDPKANQNKWIATNGAVSETAGAIVSPQITCSVGDVFTVSLDSGVGTLAISFYDASGVLLNRMAQGATNALTATAPENTAYLFAGRYKDSSANVKLEHGSTATSYEPFGSSLTLNLTSAAGGTVYGGTVTVNEDGSGELVVDRAIASVDGLSFSGVQSSSLEAKVYISASFTNSILGGSSFVCNKLLGLSFQNRGKKWSCSPLSAADSTEFAVFAEEGATKEQILSKIEGANICYALAAPITYPLTASQINSLLGYTQVITDTDGALTVGYKTDKYAKYPEVPSTDGLYILAVNMSNGAPSYSWVRLS